MQLAFDAILLLALAGFVFYGLFFGLVRAIGSLVGVLAGAWLAVHFHLPFFNLAQNLFFGKDGLGKVLCFIIIFILVNRLVGFLFVFLDMAFLLLSIIPFLKTINRLAGAVFGFLEGGLVLGLALFLLADNFGSWKLLSEFLDGSKLAPFLLKFLEVSAPLWPNILERLPDLI